MASEFERNQHEHYMADLKGIRTRLAESLKKLAVESQNAQTVRHKIKRIDDALQRLADGTFGRCIKCNKSIADERLRNLPYAEHCLPCRQEYEGSVQSDSST